MATTDGRIYKPGNRCACGKPIGGYASRCKSCNMRHQHATGVRPRKPQPFRGPHTSETRAKMSAAHRGDRWTPERTAKRIASDPRCYRLDEATLRHFYLGQGLSCAAMARQPGCNRDTVRRAMDHFGIPRRSKAGESRLRFAEHPTLRVRLQEGASRHNRERWKDPAYRAAMRTAIRRSFTPERIAALVERHRAQRQDPAYREREDARLRALSRRETKPWAAGTIARLRKDPAFEAVRQERQRFAVREGWRIGRLGPKGKVPFTRRDGTTVVLGSWAEAIVARWLDALQICWVQPPCSLLLPGGRSYRPDFWLVDSRRYLEVKGGRYWLSRERTTHPSRVPNAYAAKAAGLPVFLLEVAYLGPKLCPDLARAARRATTLDGRPLGHAISELILGT